MKKSFYLVLFLLGLLITSCQVESNMLEIENEANSTLKISNLSKVTTNGSSPETSSQDFETYMHWSSFITGRLLRYYPEHRTDVINLLGIGETIPLEDLLSNNTLFHSRFRTLLIDYINCCPDPDQERIKPPPPPPPPGPPPFGEPEPEVIADYIIDFLVNDNCIELYFPVGVDFSGAFEITTTAHPLTGASNNEGILRFYRLQTISDVGDDDISTLTNSVNVNSTYVNQNDNVIVARPYRLPWDDVEICIYLEYSDIDFTDFLE